ncbi:MAG: ATP phosphoribosyltransferase [Alistipes sp.]|nr:ATP phosphoribosyltransferase [Alistipes sp.]MBR5811766.1 ATP phosphoribosyltransferase [Alistipes sp.]
MLRIAIQTKGRLNEQSVELLREIGIDVEGAKRKFLSKASNFPIEVLYLRDDDIPQVVADGTATLGIVGMNEVAERGCDVEVVAKLGFGGCRISLAIPKADEYNGVEYFQGKKIATSYPGILSKFLADNGVEASMAVITGSVEIAPAAGIADAIFDIVSSGGTLVSNGLKEVERVFESEAVLIANRNLTDEEREVLNELLFRIESERVSRGKKYLLMNIPTASLDEAVKILPAMRSPTVMPLAVEGWCSLHSVVDSADLWDKVRQLKAIGAEGILVLTLDKIIP